MKLKLILTLSILLASCTSNSYYIYLDGKDIGDEGYSNYTPSVEINDYSNTFTSAIGRFATLTLEEDKKLDFRIIQPKQSLVNDKLIIMMPGHQGIWMSLMPLANILLNEGYHIIFIDYYGEPNGLRAEKDKNWGEKEIDELVLLANSLDKVKGFENYKIGYFGSSLGTLVGLSALSQTDKIDCYVGEGMPVNPRRSAENIVNKSFWTRLFIDLDEYDDLINKYNPKNNLEKTHKNTSLYFFWGDDDEYYFEEDWVPISELLKSNFPNSKYMIFENAKHSNRLGKDITKEKFDEINQSILQFFNENL